jgi:hypothetical protein
MWQPLMSPLVSEQAEVDRATSTARTQKRPSAEPGAQRTGQPAPDVQGNKASDAPLITPAEYASLEDDFRHGRIEEPETLYLWSVRLLQAEQVAQDSPGDGPMREHLRRMQRLEEFTAQQGTTLAKAAAQYYRLEAEAELSGVMLSDER